MRCSTGLGGGKRVQAGARTGVARGRARLAHTLPGPRLSPANPPTPRAHLPRAAPLLGAEGLEAPLVRQGTEPVDWCKPLAFLICAALPLRAFCGA